MRRLLFSIALLIQLPVFADTNKLRVGVVQSLTGIAAEDGKTVVQALQLAASDLEEQTGTAIDLIIEDDQTSSKNAVTAFQKIVSRRPDAIVAATWDFTTNPVLPLARQYQVPLLSTSTLPESLDLERAGGFAFVNAIRASDEARPFRQFLAHSNARTVAIVYANNSWGETQLNVYGKIARDVGVDVVEELKPATYDQNEWRDLVPRIKQKKADIVLLLLNKNDLAVFLRRAQEISLPGKLFASKNAYDAFGTDSKKSLFENLCFTYPLERIKAEQEFRGRYRARFSEEPRIYADNSYDALFLIEKAWRQARSTRVSLKESLASVSHDGIVGRYRLDPANSFSLGESSLVCVEGGELKVKRAG